MPYPHTPQYEHEVLFSNRFRDLSPFDPARLPGDIKGMSQSGVYTGVVNDERMMCVGGQATRWAGITPRFRPESFRPKSLHGYGQDWPVTYDELEPYYGAAEQYLSISGSASDNPFAAPRSQDFPLPPFDLSYQDRHLAERLKRAGIVTHTTPQARTRHAHDGRPGCQNFGVCETCPLGARYSPNHHLSRAAAGGLLTLHTHALVRRIVVERDRARALVYHPNHGAAAVEHPADIIIVAAGGLESARLLLLSKAGGIHRHGIGNESGQVGRNLGFHHIWWGHMEFKEKTMPGRAGPPTLLSHQFVEPPGLRHHGGVSVELFDSYNRGRTGPLEKRDWRSAADILEAMRPVLNCRSITFNAEVRPSPVKYVELGGESDRFGDPFLHLHYELDDFDHQTYAFAGDIGKRFAGALAAESLDIVPIEQFWSAHHHLGTCRMGTDRRDSVVDSYGAVHETGGLYVCGGGTFVTPTALQPTLTMVALAIRTADCIRKTMAATRDGSA
ncbi:MAG TPA: GMC family oxidoreductase [Burkholderiaceae bacterium]|nr:GMC family oxidoreductase [Burkholderiaceae bacterium]